MAAGSFANRIFHPLLSLLILSIIFGFAQTSAAANKEQLIEGAKKEGEVILYASMNFE